jgi:CMP-N,N'-diacetyllegionaminic acid synthase
MVGDRLVPLYEDERGRMATHELPEVFVRNCSVYATRRAVLENGSILGDDCRGYVMPRARSIDINDEFDFAVAEVLLARSGGS